MKFGRFLACLVVFGLLLSAGPAFSKPAASPTIAPMRSLIALPPKVGDSFTAEGTVVDTFSPYSTEYPCVITIQQKNGKSLRAIASFEGSEAGLWEYALPASVACGVANASFGKQVRVSGIVQELESFNYLKIDSLEVTSDLYPFGSEVTRYDLPLRSSGTYPYMTSSSQGYVSRVIYSYNNPEQICSAIIRQYPSATLTFTGQVAVKKGTNFDSMGDEDKKLIVDRMLNICNGFNDSLGSREHYVTYGGPEAAGIVSLGVVYSEVHFKAPYSGIDYLF